MCGQELDFVVCFEAGVVACLDVCALHHDVRPLAGTGCADADVAPCGQGAAPGAVILALLQALAFAGANAQRDAGCLGRCNQPIRLR